MISSMLPLALLSVMQTSTAVLARRATALPMHSSARVLMCQHLVWATPAVACLATLGMPQMLAAPVRSCAGNQGVKLTTATALVSKA